MASNLPGLRARIAAHTRAATYDGLEVTAKARQAFRDSFTDRAREDAQSRGLSLSDSELARRGESLRNAHYARLAYASAKARASKAGT